MIKTSRKTHFPETSEQTYGAVDLQTVRILFHETRQFTKQKLEAVHCTAWMMPISPMGFLHSNQAEFHVKPHSAHETEQNKPNFKSLK